MRIALSSCLGIGLWAIVASGELAAQVQIQVQVQLQPAPVPAVPPQKADPAKPKEEPKEKEPEPFNQKKADQELIKTAGYTDDLAALLKFFKNHTVTEADRVRLAGLIRKLGDDSFDVREAASTELKGFSVAAISLLRQAQKDPDIEVVRRAEECLKSIEKVPTNSLAMAAARLLVNYKGDGITETLINYLPLVDDESVSDEVRATLATIAVRDGKVDTVLNDALEHRDAVKRGAAAEAFARSSNKEQQDRMRKFLDKEPDSDNKLRIAMALTSSKKDKEIIPEIIRLMGELPQEKSWRAEELLFRMAGENSPPNISIGADKASREKARDEWKAWWEKNKEKVDLAKLNENDRLIGNTMLVEMDNRGGAGRILEIGPDGKEKWKITGLQFPIDAVMLPGGQRLIVAEQNNGQISERDLTGKTIWTKQVFNVAGLQRLPNGNLLIVARNQILEWNRKQEQVFLYNHNQGDICAGAKLRTGEYIFITQNGRMVKLDNKGVVKKDVNIGRNYYWAGMQVLPNGKVLLTQQNRIAEFDTDSGQAGWSVTTQLPASVQRLPNGNTLVGSMNRQAPTELDHAGKATNWKYESTDANFRAWRVYRR